MYLIKRKSKLFLIFKEFKTQVELESMKRNKGLRINNRGEHVDGDF